VLQSLAQARRRQPPVEPALKCTLLQGAALAAAQDGAVDGEALLGVEGVERGQQVAEDDHGAVLVALAPHGELATHQVHAPPVQAQGLGPAQAAGGQGQEQDALGEAPGGGEHSRDLALARRPERPAPASRALHLVDRVGGAVAEADGPEEETGEGVEAAPDRGIGQVARGSLPAPDVGGGNLVQGKLPRPGVRPLADAGS
jgi:hypothetical protein